MALLLGFAPAAEACVPPPGAGAENVPAAGVLGAIIDGDTVRLVGGPEVRLVGIQAPKLPLGRPNYPAWPLAPEAKAALSALVRDKRVRLHPGQTPIDRHGRILAQLYVEDAAGDTSWVQGALLSQGWARVYTFADNRACAAALLAAERAARMARRGIWALPYYAIRDAARIPPADTGTFQLVEGRVLAVADRGKRAYLNFGADWKTDFTAMLEPPALALFRAEGYDLGVLAGRRVRVRGWVEMFNGPMIAVTHPEQIETLDEAQ